MEEVKVKRPNNLIEARYYLTSKQNDIIDLVLSKIKKDDNKLEYEIALIDYINLFEVGNTNMYNDFKKAVKEFNKNASFTVFNYNGEEEQEIFWFVKIIYKNKEGRIIFKLDSEVKDILLQLKNFTLYNIKYPLNMTSVYSKRFYYYLKRFEDTHIRIDKLDDLLKKLNCPNSYKKYSFFKNRVLDMAEKEINGQTDIKFDYEEIKTGRKVTSLKFNIFKNNSKRKEEVQTKTKHRGLELPENRKEKDDLIETISSFIKEPLKSSEIEYLLEIAHNDVNLIKAKYNIAKQQLHINNLTAWLISAIKNDYAEPVETESNKPMTNTPKVNRFVNYDQRNWDFEKLEKLERDYIKRNLER